MIMYVVTSKIANKICATKYLNGTRKELCSESEIK
jgi:hypothetical protein